MTDDTQYLTTRTKGLRLTEPVPLQQLRRALAKQPAPIDGALFTWPLLTLDDDALAHNIATLATLCAQRDIWHAPHVKTPMSAQIWDRQLAAGAWAATVGTIQQWRTAYDWGARRIFFAHQVLDTFDAFWILRQLVDDPTLDVWLQVDSEAGVQLLCYGLASLGFDDPSDFADSDAFSRLHVMVEFGVAQGRTGVRGVADAVAMAKTIKSAGLPLGGVTGFEAPAAQGQDPRASLGLWCSDLAQAARVIQTVATGSPGPFVVSAGGSAYLDIVLDHLAPLGKPRPLGDDVKIVIRSGAYVTHDHAHYARLNPLARIEGGFTLKPAMTVWTQVVSVPEQGLALLNAGRRDVAFDIDLPIPLWRRTAPPLGQTEFGPRVDFAPNQATVTDLNDQHAFMHFAGDALHPGDLVGLGMSHPCTVFDKWRIAAVTQEDAGRVMVVDVYGLDF